jgi:hypothetical protein
LYFWCHCWSNGYMFFNLLMSYHATPNKTKKNIA